MQLGYRTILIDLLLFVPAALGSSALPNLLLIPELHGQHQGWTALKVCVTCLRGGGSTLSDSSADNPIEYDQSGQEERQHKRRYHEPELSTSTTITAEKNEVSSCHRDTTCRTLESQDEEAGGDPEDEYDPNLGDYQGGECADADLESSSQLKLLDDGEFHSDDEDYRSTIEYAADGEHAHASEDFQRDPMEVILTLEDEDAIQAQEEAFPDVPTEDLQTDGENFHDSVYNLFDYHNVHSESFDDMHQDEWEGGEKLNRESLLLSDNSICDFESRQGDVAPFFQDSNGAPIPTFAHASSWKGNNVTSFVSVSDVEVQSDDNNDDKEHIQSDSYQNGSLNVVNSKTLSNSFESHEKSDACQDAEEVNSALKDSSNSFESHEISDACQDSQEVNSGMKDSSNSFESHEKLDACQDAEEVNSGLKDLSISIESHEKSDSCQDSDQMKNETFSEVSNLSVPDCRISDQKILDHDMDVLEHVNNMIQEEEDAVLSNKIGVVDDIEETEDNARMLDMELIKDHQITSVDDELSKSASVDDELSKSSDLGVVVDSNQDLGDANFVRPSMDLDINTSRGFTLNDTSNSLSHYGTFLHMTDQERVGKYQNDREKVGQYNMVDNLTSQKDEWTVKTENSSLLEENDSNIHLSDKLVNNIYEEDFDITHNTERSLEGLGTDIETETDLCMHGSDSTASIDRMDFADAYDADDEKYGMNQDDDNDKDATIFLKGQDQLSSMSQNLVQRWRMPFIKVNVPRFLRRDPNEVTLTNLGYSLSEIRSMKPSVRSVLLSKKIRKPRNGLPSVLFISQKLDGANQSRYISTTALKYVTTTVIAASLALLCLSKSPPSEAEVMEDNSQKDEMPTTIEENTSVTQRFRNFLQYFIL